MDFLPQNINDYSEQHTSPESDLLKKLNRDTHVKILQPRMLSGHLQGRYLAEVSYMMRPRRILEIGTYTGYSALCLAEGLVDDGKIITIDVNEELETFTRSFFDESPYANKIDYRIGDAGEIIPTLDEVFDLVFIDADKTGYAQYYGIAKSRLRSGGLILADNVLFHGDVLEEPIKGKNAKAIHAFNEMVSADDEVEKIMLTLRDGLFLIRKK